jgi:hypothetical protein
MHVRFKHLLAIALACLVLLPLPARAQIVVSFYSHELGASFPHAFITIKGKPTGGGAAIDANYGFTAKSVTPAILMGSVYGVIESAKPGYIENSDRKFALTITDAQYASLMALIEKWRELPGKSYNLNSRNCIHFVGQAAQLLGLKVEFDKKLLKRPRSFLENIVRLNPGLGTFSSGTPARLTR